MRFFRRGFPAGWSRTWWGCLRSARRPETKGVKWRGVKEKWYEMDSSREILAKKRIDPPNDKWRDGAWEGWNWRRMWMREKYRHSSFFSLINLFRCQLPRRDDKAERLQRKTYIFVRQRLRQRKDGSSLLRHRHCQNSASNIKNFWRLDQRKPNLIKARPIFRVVYSRIEERLRIFLSLSLFLP